ncbi:MAG: RES domain-containing protein [Thermoleophilia bacterium]|jgi:RES domain-containing protein
MEPLWSAPLAFVQPTQPPARWNSRGELAQYAAQQVDAAWAELIRQEDLSAHDTAYYRRSIWMLQITEPRIADLSTFDRAAHCGIDPAILVDDDHTRCHALRAELESAGFTGVLAPSAALPDATSITLFGPRTAAAPHERIPERLRGVYVEASLIAEEALVPARLLTSTRRHGDDHAAFEAWRTSVS